MENWLDNMFEEIIEELNKQQIKRLAEVLKNGHALFNYILNSEKKSRLSDEYIEVQNDKENRLNELVSMLSIICLDYARDKNINISTNEFFFTEKCFVEYKDSLYQIEQVSGQGTYEKISVVEKTDNEDILKYTDILDWVKECLNTKEEQV